MEMEYGEPNVRQFFTAVVHDWLSLVSGARSVPFTVIALYSDAQYARRIWLALAAAGIALTAYRVWAQERSTVCSLQLRVQDTDKRRKTSAAVAALINQALVLRSTVPRANQDNHWAADVQSWTDSALAYLVESCSPAAGTKFRDTSRPAMDYSGVGAQLQNTYGILAKLISNLYEIQEKPEVYFE